MHINPDGLYKIPAFSQAVKWGIAIPHYKTFFPKCNRMSVFNVGNVPYFICFATSCRDDHHVGSMKPHAT